MRRQRLSYKRSYIKNERNAYTCRLHRAYAEADVLYNMKPIINDGELIFGLPDTGVLSCEFKNCASYGSLTALWKIGGIVVSSSNSITAEKEGSGIGIVTV